MDPRQWLLRHLPPPFAETEHVYSWLELVRTRTTEWIAFIFCRPDSETWLAARAADGLLLGLCAIVLCLVLVRLAQILLVVLRTSTYIFVLAAFGALTARASLTLAERLSSAAAAGGDDK